METGTKQRQAAKAFVRDWTGKGYEKGETQRFWLDLLHRVFGVDNNDDRPVSFQTLKEIMKRRKGV